MNAEIQKKMIKQLKIADMRMRELFGFYWHREGNGITQKQIDALTTEIKAGEALLKFVEQEEAESK